MKAMRLNGWGQPLQLEDIPQPTPAGDEVLVRVHAASINPLDAMIQAGYLQGYVSVPLTMGTDFAGEAVEVGSEITHIRPGDAVFGLVPMRSGAFAEYLVAKANEVTRKPKTLDFHQSAGVPLACLAAYQSLFTLGQAQKTERVLIIGAAGAVGATAIQLAKNAGLYVYAVDFPEKADFVHQLGPDRFIDGKTERFEDITGKVDLVLDFVGGDHLQRCYSVLEPGGRYVTSLFLPEANEAEKRGIRTAALAVQPRVDHLDDLAQRIDSHQLKTFVNCTFPLLEAQSAFEHRMKSLSPGKIILSIQ
jgi:NADPH:quinone reductase-like Zn-dependent oxidoreductase